MPDDGCWPVTQSFMQSGKITKIRYSYVKPSSIKITFSDCFSKSGCPACGHLINTQSDFNCQYRFCTAGGFGFAADPRLGGFDNLCTCHSAASFVQSFGWYGGSG